MAKTKDPVLTFWEKTPVVLFFGFFFCFLGILLVKHFVQFQTFALDLGFYDQIVYKASRFDFTRSQIATVLPWNLSLSFWENDFHPTLLPLTPLYWFLPGPWWLFLVQSLLAAGIAFPIYYLSRRVVGSPFFSLAVTLASLLLVTHQHAVFDGFTPEVIGAFFLALFFYAFYTANRGLMGMAALAMVVSKVEFSPVVAILGVIILFVYKDRKVGFGLALFGIAVFVFLVYIFNPAISPEYRNYAHYSLGYGDLGNSPLDLVRNLFLRPRDFATAIISPPTKIEAVFTQLASFAFLPIFGGRLSLLLGYEYFVRFVNTVMAGKWLLHGFTFTPILATMAILAAARWQKRAPVNYLALVLLLATLVSNVVWHGPINSLFKREFYQVPQFAKDNRAVLAEVPRDTAVAANNSLVPHLSSRAEVYLLPDTGDAAYIIVDWHDSPNAFAPAGRDAVAKVVGELQASGSYKQVGKRGEVVLLKKI